MQFLLGSIVLFSTTFLFSNNLSCSLQMQLLVFMRSFCKGYFHFVLILFQYSVEHVRIGLYKIVWALMACQFDNGTCIGIIREILKARNPWSFQSLTKESEPCLPGPTPETSTKSENWDCVDVIMGLALIKKTQDPADLVFQKTIIGLNPQVGYIFCIGKSVLKCCSAIIRLLPSVRNWYACEL